ncbi:hypothetical protein ACLQ9F_12380 [Bordetella avium]|uniref:hypothetical protein n=1 Tax=Bordetella avium TaxID=521 RepID=UPI001379164E|nr:hypothetical protein [Bordetella avium]
MKSILFGQAQGKQKTRVVLAHTDTGEEASFDLDGDPAEHRQMSVPALQKLAVEQIDLA